MLLGYHLQGTNLRMEKKEIKVLCFCRTYSDVVHKKKQLINNSKLGLREDISFKEAPDSIVIVHRDIKRNNETGVLEKNEEVTYRYLFLTFHDLDQKIRGHSNYYLSNLSDQFSERLSLIVVSSIKMDCLGVVRYNEKTEEFVVGDKKWIGSLYNELQ